MTDTKSVDTKAPAKVPKPFLKAVHGLLIHPFTKPEVRFTTEAPVRHEIDGWVKQQMEAGKLVEDVE